MAALTVVFWSQFLGGVMFLGLAAVRGETTIATPDIIWSVLAGLCGPTALVFFYRGLAVGRMGVVAPIAGVLGAGIPVVVGGVLEGLPTLAQVAGIALALVSVLLVTRTSEPGAADRRSVGLALAAGLGFGLFFVFLGRVSSGPVFLPLVIVRLVATILVSTIVLTTRGSWRIRRSSLVPVVISGVLDAGGNLWYLLAVQQGRLDVAAVLASLYPVVTIVVAAVLLRERFGRLQAAGIAAAVGAIVLIAAG
jgi:drug/metabolite transporter (DMT)-like permease